MLRDDLLDIYRTALERCDPQRLVREALEGIDIPSPVDVVALGKCGGTLLDGAANRLAIIRAFAAVPAGYAMPRREGIDLAIGTHPELSAKSFEAGDRLLRFVRDAAHPIVFLISGGASASIEAPLEPWFSRDDLVEANRRLIRAGLPIDAINTVRKHLSAIKGGRLGAQAPAGSRTFVLSDVPAGRPEIVGSGPTVADDSTNVDAARILESMRDAIGSSLAARLRSPSVPETVKASAPPSVIADNRTLAGCAAERALSLGYAVARLDEELTGDVAECAELLWRRSRSLAPRQILLAGGEPSVRVTGAGRGGRCGEIALRLAAFALREGDATLHLLAGSSDGVDGNSGTAGALLLPPFRTSPAEIDGALAESDSARLLEKVGEPIMIPPTGNNLRDLYILARG